MLSVFEAKIMSDLVCFALEQIVPLLCNNSSYARFLCYDDRDFQMLATMICSRPLMIRCAACACKDMCVGNRLTVQMV